MAPIAVIAGAARNASTRACSVRRSLGERYGVRLLMVFAMLLAGCGASPRPSPVGAWQTEVFDDHPLVGRIWSTKAQAFISADQLVTQVRAARYVLLGEQHDHPDHHRVQAWLVGALADRLGGAAFEMLDEDDRAGVERAIDAATLATAVAWQKSGWPDFALYQPIFEALFRRGIAIHVAHPTRETMRRVMTDGIGQWPKTRVVRLALDVPLPARDQAALEAQIRTEHCGYAPEKIVAPMALAQRVKDAWMARALVDASRPAVLIAGNGHVRRDRGVPFYLRRHDPTGIRSLAQLAVRPGVFRPEDYDAQLYDFVLFTPRTTNEDPCVRFKKQLEKMRTRRARP